MKRIASLFLTLVLALSLAAPAAAAEDASGTTVRLAEANGTVTVKDAAGKAKTTRTDMRLYNGYTIETGASSSAYISLDDSKAIKLGSSGKVEVKKSGKKLEVSLLAGELFVNVTEPLKSSESLSITTSTTITGIRGTVVSVSTKGVQEFDGHTNTTIFPKGDNMKPIDIPLQPGQKLDIEKILNAVQQAVDDNKAAEEIQQRMEEAAQPEPLQKEDFTALVVEELAKDRELAERVTAALEEAGSDMSVPELVESLPELQAQEAAAEQAAQQATEAAVAQQEQAVAASEAENQSNGNSSTVDFAAEQAAAEAAQGTDGQTRPDDTAAREAAEAAARADAELEAAARAAEAAERGIQEADPAPEAADTVSEPAQPTRPTRPSSDFTVQWGNNTPGELFWDAVDGADGYRITMRSETGEEKISGFHDDPRGNMCYDLAELGEGSYTISVSAFKGNELLGNSDNTLTAIVSVTSAATYSADYDESHKILTYEFTASAGTAQDGHWYRLLAECGNNHCSWSIGNVYSDNTVNANLTQRELSQPLEDGDYIDVRIFTNLSTNGSTQSFTVSDAAHTQKSDLRRAERVKVTASDSQGGKLLVNSLESFYVLKSNASFTLTSNSAFAFNQNTTHVTMNGDALTVNVVDYSTLTVSGFSVNSSDDVNLQVSNDGGTGSSSQYGISFPTDSSNLHLTFTASSWPADDSLYVKLARADGDSFGNKVAQTSNSIPIPPKAGTYTEAAVYYYRNGNFSASANNLITTIQLPGTLTIAEDDTTFPSSTQPISGTVSSENDIPILTILNLTPGYVYYYQPAETDDLDPVTLNGTGTADTVSGTVHTNQGSGTLYALKGEPASGSSSGYLVTVTNTTLSPTDP